MAALYQTEKQQNGNNGKKPANNCYSIFFSLIIQLPCWRGLRGGNKDYHLNQPIAVF
jgi:hypothetical protein